MTKEKKYNLLFLDDGFLTVETGLMSAVYLWIIEVYGKYLNIYHARDIKEGISMVNKIGKLDILITDMNLPPFGIPPESIDKYHSGKFGGVFFIDEMLKVNPDIKVIIASGREVEEYSHMLDKRIKIALSKPFSLEILETHIDTLVQEVIGIETNKEWKKRKNK